MPQEQNFDPAAQPAGMPQPEGASQFVPAPGAPQSVPSQSAQVSTSPYAGSVGFAAPPQPASAAGCASQPVRQRVHHTFIWLGTLRGAISMFVALAVIGFSTLFGDALNGFSAIEIGGLRISGAMLVVAGLFVLFFVVLAIAFVVQLLSYKHLYYEVGDDEFSLYSGIINKKRVHVPYQRIQSVDQKASLIQRIAGVCFVSIDTAGGSSNKAITIPYITNAEAERLRAELFARKRAILLGQAGAKAAAQTSAVPGQAPGGYPPAMPGAMPGGPASAVSAAAYVPSMQAAPAFDQEGNLLDLPAEVIADARGVFGGDKVYTGTVSYEYGMSNKELVLTGLSNNTGVIVIVLAILGAVGGLIEPLLSNAFLRAAAEGGADLVVRTFAGNAVVAGIVVAAVVFAVLWVVSIVGTCLSYGGFKARRRDRRIEVERGILQHRFQGVDIDRVQSVVVKQSFIRRILGYCELSLGKIDAATDGSDGGSQQASLTTGTLVIHPFVKVDRVPGILAGLVPEFADVPVELRPVAKVGLRRAIVRRAVLQGDGFWLAVIVAALRTLLEVFRGPAEAAVPGIMYAADIATVVLAVLCVVLAVLNVVGAVLWHRGSGFAFNRRFFQITNGGFSRESVSVPRSKIQFGYTRANPLQRHANVATICARTAAGVGGTTLKLIDASAEDARAWLEWLRPGGNR